LFFYSTTIHILVNKNASVLYGVLKKGIRQLSTRIRCDRSQG
jgi:hypothetical protein